MAAAVYILCMLTSAVGAFLLLRGYARTRVRLLAWSGLCFAGLALNNVLLFVDRIVVPDTDLSIWRQATALAALSTLLYGLIWDAD
jgi:hypothetical protein